MCAPSNDADAHTEPAPAATESPGKHAPSHSGNSAQPGKRRDSGAQRWRTLAALHRKYPRDKVRYCPAALGRYADPRHKPHRWSDFPPDYDLKRQSYPRGRPTDRQRAERAGRGYWLCPGAAELRRCHHSDCRRPFIPQRPNQRYCCADACPRPRGNRYTRSAR